MASDTALMHADALSYFEFWRRMVMYYPYNQFAISRYEYWFVVASDLADALNREEDTKPLEIKP